MPGSTTTTYEIDSTPSAKHGGFGTSGILIRDRTITPKHVTDGVSHTFLMGEAAWDIGETAAWIGGLSTARQNSMTTKNIANPLNSYKFVPALNQLYINDTSFGSEHAGRGANFLMGDGSVHFISDNIAMDTLKSLASRKSAEVPVENPF